jgi:hypothetical protein
MERALDKLRRFFSQRGAVFTAVAIATAVSANSVQAAPTGLAKTISAVAATKGAAAGTSTLTLVKGTIKVMAWSKAKIGIITGAVVLLVAGTTAGMVEYHAHKPPAFPPAQPIADGQTEFPKASWRFAGFGNPESAFESSMWAVGNNDSTLFKATISPSLQQTFASHPEHKTISIRDQADFWRMTGYRILDKQTISENEMRFQVYAEGLDQTQTFTIQRLGDQWRFAGKAN